MTLLLNVFSCSDGAVCSWLGAELRAVCGGTGSEEEEEEDREVRHKVLTRKILFTKSTCTAMLTLTGLKNVYISMPRV